MAKIVSRVGDQVAIRIPGMGVSYVGRSSLPWRALGILKADPARMIALMTLLLDRGKLARLPAGARAVVTRRAWPWVHLRVEGLEGTWCVPHEFAIPVHAGPSDRPVKPTLRAALVALLLERSKLARLP